LRALAGRTHELNSAVAVARDGKLVFSHVAIARMTMRLITVARAVAAQYANVTPVEHVAVPRPEARHHHLP
jgi:predicted house-cleaning NTP pyrophosphatase (Maf/HAM1 superfamily)